MAARFDMIESGICQIWKFQLEGPDNTIDLPKGSWVIDAQFQAGSGICIWAVVDTITKEKDTRRFRVIGTGHDFDWDFFDMQHIDTIQVDGLVWHIFEDLRVEDAKPDA